LFLAILCANALLAQVQWTRYSKNPVLDTGSRGTWDSASVSEPCVIFDGVMYKMWYIGFDGSVYRIGYATSPDGIAWIKSLDNPVLDTGKTGTWEDVWISAPSVLFDGNTYRMWYNGYDGGHWRIGYATSSDGVIWEKHLANPVLNLGPGGAWDQIHVFDPTVVFHDNIYEMWYSGDDDSNNRIGYATSTDGIVWKKHPNNPVLDVGPGGAFDHIYADISNVIINKGAYEMWYVGEADTDPSNNRIGYAASFDGIVWKKYPGNPVLDIGKSGSWDDMHVSRPSVIFDGDDYKMWYCGHDGSRWGIGYATSPYSNISLFTKGDVDGDGVITSKDAILALSISISIIVPSEYQRWAADMNSDGKIRSDDVILILQKASGLAALGIENMRFSALLQNFPNPFNPETWIPYQLKEDCEVNIRIFDISGNMIREFALGFRPAGTYTSRGKALYWDGRNSTGEPVANGVYFYTIHAGDFRATRKMVISQ